MRSPPSRRHHAPRRWLTEHWLRKGSADVAGFDLIDHGREMPIERLVERLVAVQLKTLESHRVVRQALEAGAVRLHGAVYNPRSSRLRVFDPATDTFREQGEESNPSAFASANSASAGA